MVNILARDKVIPELLERQADEADRQFQFVQNIVTPEFIEQERRKGPLTFMESFRKAKKWGYAVPYIGTAAEAGENLWLVHINNKVRKGQFLTNEEMKKYKDYVLDMASSSARGATLPAQVFNGFLENVPYMVEMGIGLATAPSGVGLSSIGWTGAKMAAKKMAKGELKNLTKAAINRGVAKQVFKDSTIGAMKFEFNPHMLLQDVKRFGEIQLDNDLYLTPEGQVLLNEAEQSPAMALLKTFGSQYAEILSETSGYAFSGLGKFGKNALFKHLPSNFARTLDKSIKKVTGLAPAKALKQYGYNGIIEEMGEERVGDLLKFAMNLDGKEGYSYEQFLNALFPAKEQLATEALTFALSGAVFGGGVNLHNNMVKKDKYLSIAQDVIQRSTGEDGNIDMDVMKSIIREQMPSISDERLNKYITAVKDGIKKAEDYSVEDFLLDSGVFRKFGRYSIVDNKVNKILQNGNLTNEQISDFMNFATLAQKQQLIRNIAGEDNEEEFQNIKNSIIEKFKEANSFSDDNEREASAHLFTSVIQNLAAKYNMSPREILEKDLPRIINDANIPHLLKAGIQKDDFHIVDDKIQELKSRLDELEELETNLVLDGGAGSQKDEDSFSGLPRRSAPRNDDLQGARENVSNDDTVDDSSFEDIQKEQENILAQIQLLEELKKGNLKGANLEKAHKLLNTSAYQEFIQSDYYAGDRNIEENFGDSVENIEQNIAENIKNILADNNISEDEFTLEGVKVYGSYSTNNNHQGSDLDFLVQYSGSMREDDAFNMFHDEDLSLTDKNGNSVVVDINPINSDLSGTIEDKLESIQGKVYRQEQTANYNSFDEFENEFTNDIEETPEDYAIKNVDEALKDLGITKDNPKVIDTPTGKVIVSADSIDHIISGGGNSHKPDKTRYKSINKMFATLERPNVVTINNKGKKSYFKLFKSNAKSKAQIVFVSNDENGYLVSTTMPVGKDKTYLINKLNEGNVIYKKGQTGVINNSAANNIITDNAESFKSVPKYINKEVTVKAVPRHYEGGYTSPKINKILDDLFGGANLDDVINKFQSADYTPEKITKIYNDYKNGVYKHIEGTPEHTETQQVLNPEYRPQYDGSDEMSADIIDDYERKTSTDTVGHGYAGYSMSNNAVTAYEQGSMPLSKWTKSKILNTIKAIADNYSIPVDLEKLNSMKAAELKNFLKKAGYHHTSKYFNPTDFYKVDIEKILDDEALKQANDKETLFDKIKNSDKFKNLSDDIKNAVEFIFTSDNVAEVKGDEFPNNGKSLNERILEYYTKKYNNAVRVENLGDVILDKRSIKNSTYHGLSENKVNAFAVVPEVLKNGYILNSIENYNGKIGVTRITIVAPIKLKDENFYCEVVVQKTKNRQGFYLHEVELTEKLADVFSTSGLTVSGTSTSSNSIIADLINNFKGDDDAPLTRPDGHPLPQGARGNVGNDNTADGGSVGASILDKDGTLQDVPLSTPPQAGAGNDVDGENKSAPTPTLPNQGGSATFYQPAYHGSPHRFDKFLTDKMGTGEGNQAHGWGLYFAGNKDVSEGYRTHLSGNTSAGDLWENVKVGNKTLDDVLDSIFENQNDKSILTQQLFECLERGDKRTAISETQRLIDMWKNLSSPSNWQKEQIKLYEKFINVLEKNDLKNEAPKGQLYKVDIPDVDEMLDEDKPFSEQSEKVQDNLKKVLRDENISIYKKGGESWEEFEKNILESGGVLNSGKRIYRQLSYLLYSDKAASLKLNEYGIKGITYDGRQDGRCYVVFDDNAVKILKTYYQEDLSGLPRSARNDGNAQGARGNIDVVDLTNEFDKTPTLDEVKKYINEIVENGTKFATLSPDWFIDIKGGSRIKGKILNRGNYKKLNKTQTDRHNKYIMSLEKLLSNAEYVGEKENTKKDKKPNVAKYHYFKTNVKVGNKVYEIVFDTEEYKNENPQSVDYAKRNLKEHSEDTNSIADNADNFKGVDDNSSGLPRADALAMTGKTVHLYNIKEVRANKYRQDNSSSGLPRANALAMTGDNAVQGNMFRDGISGREGLSHGNQNAIDRIYKGEYVSPYNVIHIFESGDKSTIIHEFAHWWLDTMARYEGGNSELDDDLQAVRKFLNCPEGEFQEHHHEKFARAFEVYMHSGFAKNNKLKKVFEYFKNALINIYTNLKNIVWRDENGNEQNFQPADVPAISELFNELLSTERQRIQSKVFDKINNLNSEIDNIRQNEELEIAELDKLYKEYIEANNRKSDIKRSVQEYLDLAEAQTSKKTKEQKAFEKRFKNATLSILSAATGYDKRFIANKNNLSLIRQALDKTNDKISTRIGTFLPEWAEFYADPGLNEDINADENLAWEAFDILESGRYELDEDEYYEENRWQAKFDYLANKVKSLKGEERYVALEALTQYFSAMPNSMPDEFKEFAADKLVKVTADISDDEMNTFNKKSLPNLSCLQYLQSVVMNKLSNLKVYNSNKKYKTRLDRSSPLYKLIATSTSVNKAKRAIKKINEYVIEDIHRQQKGILHKEIQRQIKVNAPKAMRGKMRGKFDYRVNTVFAELMEMNKQSKTALRALYTGVLQLDSVEDGENRTTSVNIKKDTGFELTDNREELLKRNFAQYRSANLRDKELPVALVERVLVEILELKRIGQQAKTLEDFKEALRQQEVKADLVSILDRNKDNKLANFARDWVTGVNPITSEGALHNWEALLSTVFDSKTAQDFSLLKLEAECETFAHEHCINFFNNIAKIYELNKTTGDLADKFKRGFTKFIDYDYLQPVINMFREFEKEKYSYSEVTWNKNEQFVETIRELSKSEIITIYAWCQNKNLRQRLENQFGINGLKDMFSHLDEKDKELAFLMIDTCEQFYESINEIYIRTVGVALPKVENYVPSKADRNCSDLDMMHDNIVRSNNETFVKLRAMCKKISMKPTSPLELIIPHINKVSRFIVMQERMNDMRRIFKDDATVAKKIKEVCGMEAGEKILRAIYNQLDLSSYSNYAKSINFGKDISKSIANNFISSAIGGNIKVAVSQLLSVINYADVMPSGAWAVGFAKALAHPKATFNYMMDNCKYLKSRLGGNSQNEVMMNLTSELDRFRSFKNFMTSNTKYGDILAIIFGGKPYVDYLISQGMSQEDAFDKFTEETLRSMQSGHNSAVSIWQKTQSQNALGRMVFAFNNTNLQYDRKFWQAVSEYAKSDRGKDATIKLAKSVFIFKVLNPIMFTSFLGNLSIQALLTGLMGGGDDDPWKEFFKDCGLAMFTSAFAGVGFLGTLVINPLLRGISSFVSDNYSLFSASPSIPFATDMFEELQDIQRLWKHFAKGDDISFVDYIDIITRPLSFAGVPAPRAKNIGYGIYDLTQGNLGQAFYELQGYSHYRATKAVTGEKPERNK